MEHAARADRQAGQLRLDRRPARRPPCDIPKRGMSPIAALMLDDLKLDTVDFVPTYDERRTEPTVLPSKFPNLLVNGANGIAVGMATSIPPHNLGEVCDALVRVIDDPGRLDRRADGDRAPAPTFPPAASSAAVAAFAAAITPAAARSSSAPGPRSRSTARTATASSSPRFPSSRPATASKSGSPRWSTKTASRASRRSATRAT